MDSASSCELAIFDGDPHLIRKDEVMNKGTIDVGDAPVVAPYPIGITMETTLSDPHERIYDYVHITNGEAIYKYMDVVVDKRQKTIGEPWVTITLSARERSIRKI